MLMEARDFVRNVGVVLALASLGSVGLSGGAYSQTPDSAPTFTTDVAPILQESCQACHNTEGIGPMSLLTYGDVLPWAPMIKEQTQIRHMPPWHVDKSIGIQEFKNDISLTDKEIETIARWVDAGAPEGDLADMPSPIEFDEGGAWRLAQELGRPPDVILKSAAFTVPGMGQDQWWSPAVPFEGLDEERWLMAAEFKPAFPEGKKVVHHGHATLMIGDDGGGAGGGFRGRGVARYGVGKSWEVYPEDVGMRIPAGEGTVNWNLHYASIDHDVVDDVVEVGLWLYPKGEVPRLETQGEVLFRVDNPNYMRGQDILIPPNGYQVLQSTHRLESATVIHSIRPHMHMRGKMMTIEAIYPDGRKELISQVNNYDHNWQLTYIYEDDARPLLPAGTVIVLTSVYDNTAENPINPDPEQWVLFGRRGPDEMGHMWIGITYVPDEELEQLVSQREQIRNSDDVAQRPVLGHN